MYISKVRLISLRLLDGGTRALSLPLKKIKKSLKYEETIRTTLT